MPKIPDSFPLDPWPAALSGAQPKLAVRLIDGKYVTGDIDDNYLERIERARNDASKVIAQGVGATIGLYNN